MTNLGIGLLGCSAISGFIGVAALIARKIPATLPIWEIREEDEPARFHRWLRWYFAIMAICAVMSVLTLLI